jgi:hypothetical protein
MTKHDALQASRRDLSKYNRQICLLSRDRHREKLNLKSVILMTHQLSSSI